MLLENLESRLAVESAALRRIVAMHRNNNNKERAVSLQQMML